jgi:hypothetical protein
MKTVQELLSEIRGSQYHGMKDYSIDALDKVTKYDRKTVEVWYQEYLRLGEMPKHVGVHKSSIKRAFQRLGFEILPKNFGMKQQIEDLKTMKMKEWSQKWGKSKAAYSRLRAVHHPHLIDKRFSHSKKS